MANTGAFQAGWKMGSSAVSKKNGRGKSTKKDNLKVPKNLKEQNEQDSKMGGPGAAVPSTLKKGGKVKKTGKALVHKGEVVLTAAQAKSCPSVKKSTKKAAHKKVVSSKR